MSEFMEVSVVAMRLNVSPATVYRLINAGRLESIKVGVSKGIRVRRQSLENFMKQGNDNEPEK